MLFNSLQFLLFFPLTTILYYCLPYKYRWLLLLIASCVFYCVFIPVYILILFFIIIVDYIAGIYIAKTEGRKRKGYLILSIVVNVGTLCIFKYTDFLIDNFNILFHSLYSTQTNLPLLHIILPIGLSFHTFQAMSYTIEVYRGTQVPERHLGIYALYVMFFPQLVAGPIERPQNVLPQLHREHSLIYENVIKGLKIMLLGFFKKCVIADRLALLADPVYKHPANYPSETLVIAVIFGTFQIYCDFSGYSDIALGTAKVLGINLMQNFNHPYTSRNITEFWRRWHISLSSWLRDYLFTPLSISSRNLEKRGVIYSLLVTFTAIGIWHGANWTYLVFGLLHGIAISYEFLTGKLRKKISKRVPAFIYIIASVLLTFIFWNFTQVFFRANTVSQAIYVVKQLPAGIMNLSHFFTFLHFHLVRLSITNVQFSISCVVILVIIGYEIIGSRQSIGSLINKQPMFLRLSVYYLIVLGMVIFGVFENRQFIYFQF